MTVSSKSDDVLEIAGILDVDAEDSLRALLSDALSRQAVLLIDLSAVEECDAAGLQVLLSCEKSAGFFGKPFKFLNVSPAVTNTASALGLSLVSEARAKQEGDQHAA